MHGYQSILSQQQQQQQQYPAGSSSSFFSTTTTTTLPHQPQQHQVQNQMSVDMLTTLVQHRQQQQQQQQQQLPSLPPQQLFTQGVLTVPVVEKPTKKRVRFSPVEQTMSFRQPNRILHYDDSSHDDLRRLWYSREELTRFRSEVEGNVSASSSGKNNKINNTDDDKDGGGDDSTGGGTWTKARMIHQFMVIQCTLSAYKRNKSNPEHIALVAKKCGEWCTNVAQLQARHDYYSVYFPSLLENSQLVPKVPTVPPKFPFLMKKKNTKRHQQQQQQQQHCTTTETTTTGQTMAATPPRNTKRRRTH